MMDLTGVRHVQARIAQLQEQFGMPGNLPGTGFSQKLEKEMQKSLGVTEAQKTSEPAVQENNQPLPAVQKVDNAKMVLADMPLADQNLSTLIEAAARKYKVDPKLVAAVAEVESNGNQDAVSSVGAIGVMQLMPDTAASLGVDPYNKQQNIEGGAKYLRQMLDTFGGDTKKAVAAYNAGPGAVKDYGGVPPYKETQNYVNKVLDIYR
ncbi:lytic transglycosylase domain-containing protein [Selenomonas ruminantium]|jgi:soluble lytic murein transglycosylase-like protein|uniref:Lytic transglycosylase domain-containing protein n=1 Tax=Selenomonas ruminantium TaxID=971 RepID=A0A927WN22_SELRU|nr:lytic transglycosylase domain-containing protein [Selenomonas ruminantium]MBE6092710.1 lytic transglycosylase domain-containing protein [Selenomonas ruminantium]